MLNMVNLRAHNITQHIFLNTSVKIPTDRFKLRGQFMNFISIALPYDSTNIITIYSLLVACC